MENSEYSVVFSKRKTIALFITNDAKLLVRAPFGTSSYFIEQVILSNLNWVRKQISLREKQNKTRKDFYLNYADEISVLEKKHTIIPSNEWGSIYCDGVFLLPPGLSSCEIKRTIVQTLKKVAKEHITQRVKYYSELMGINASKIKITSAKTRWGSCTSKKTLCFSWYLIFADKEAIDYVVVHELGHLIEFNHGSKFWDIVHKHVSDTKTIRKYLRKLEETLRTQEWE